MTNSISRKLSLSFRLWMRMCLFIVGGMLFTGIGALAQVTSGSIIGNIHDQSGAVIPNAKVTATDIGKGSSTSVLTNGSGDFTIPFLLPGTYDVAVESAGFKKTVSHNVILDIDQKQRVDLDLSPGGTSETVEVTTTPSLIKTDTSELGDVVSKREVENLPLNGRNFAQLTYLVPGVTSLLTWALLGERLTLVMVLGLVIASVGCWLVGRNPSASRTLP